MLERLTLFLCLMLLSCPVFVQAQEAAAQGSVKHYLSFPELRLQFLHLESEFPVDTENIELLVPTWVPGSYRIQPFDANVEILSIKDEQGRNLSFERGRRDSWNIATPGAAHVTVSYRVYAAGKDVRSSWVSPDFVLINPATAFLYTDSTRELGHELTISVPEGLGSVKTSMLESPSADNSWQVADFDELVDSPFVISPDPAELFEVGGYPFALVNVGNDGSWVNASVAQDLGKMIDEIFKFWEVIPLTRRYWFLNLLTENGGGLEHDYNTVMMASRSQTRNRDDYIKWLGLASHEFFHVWNVRRMRPAAIGTYDYRGEQHTGSLWLAEGFTSYYDDLLLVRSELIKPIEYFKNLAANFHKLELTPGRLKISLDQSSRDAWTRAYQPNDNAINANVSYYTKGAVLAFVLDSRIREESNDRKSLDDVMRLMYQRWDKTPYPEDAFADALEAEAGAKIRAWFEPLVNEPGELDIDTALANYGLVLDRKDSGDDQQMSAIPAGFGINWEEEGEQLIVQAVVHGLSAAEAGIIPGDELLAINSERVTADNLDKRQKRLRAGETVEFLISRHERLQTVQLTTGLPRPEKYQIKIDGDISKRRLKRLESWLSKKLTRK